MKRTLKKSMSILLALTLLFGSFAFGFSDVNWSELANSFAVKAEAAETFTEGYYTYTVDDEGNATITDVDEEISGEVIIPSTLGGYTVTSIGANSFNECVKITHITIPNGVIYIQYQAFNYCLRLESITIGNSVESIGNMAFFICPNLKTITIPDSVKIIGAYTFELCDSLANVNIGKGLNFIGDSSFASCDALTSIRVDKENPTYSSDEYGVLFDRDKTELIHYPQGSTRTSYVIPKSVTNIKEGSLYCKNLTSIFVDSANPSYSSDENGVVFNKNRTELIQYPIGKTSTNYVIPNGVTTIGDFAFYDCVNLKSVTIPNSVEGIGDCAFCHCSYIENVTLNKGLKKIGQQAFSSCTSLKKITIPDGVMSIGEQAFDHCYALTDISMPDSIIKINNGSFSFSGYYEDESNWENGVLYIGNHLIDATAEIAGEYIIKAGTKTIADSAFAYCSNLTNVIFSDSVVSIGASAFASCDKLTNIIIPAGVTNIGDSAFAHCDKLTNITVDSENSLYSSDDCGVLFNKDKSKLIQYPIGNARTNYVIPNNVTGICDYAFTGNNSLTSVKIPDSLTTIGKYAFSSCGHLSTVYYLGTDKQWNEISFGEGNYNYYIIVFECDSERPYYGSGMCGENVSWILYTDGELVIDGTGEMYDFGDNGAPWNINHNHIKTVTIGNGITNISGGAFGYCFSLRSIMIPESIASIGDSIFTWCSDLESVYYPGTAEQWNKVSVGMNNEDLLNSLILESDSDRPYYYPGACGKTATYTLYTDGELVIDGTGDMYDFNSQVDAPWWSRASKIKTVTVNSGITSIGKKSFCYYNNMTSVTLPVSITSIGDSAFYGCTLSSAYYPGTAEDWAKVFVGELNENLTNNIVFESDSSRPYYGSGTCGENLEWTLYADGELVISGTGEMYNYSSWDNTAPWYGKKANIKSLTISDGVTNIGDYAFYNCENLADISIPDSVASIGNDAFYETGYYNDESNWENSVLYIGNHLIKANYSIKGDYVVKENTKTIGFNAFGGCEGVTSITIPADVTNIGYAAFVGMSKLTNITVNSANTNYSSDEYGALFNKNKTVLIQYPVGNTRTSYEIPDSVTSIEYGAFGMCTILETVTISDNVTIIGDYAFAYCQSLTDIIVPDSVTSIDNCAFYGCTKLVSVLIGNGVTNIKEGAFADCPSLTSVTIPDSVTSIGDAAFYGCCAIEYVHIPSSVTSIGDSIIMSDSEKAEMLAEVNTMLKNASEEELAYYAEMGITPESVANWKPTTVICSDSEDSAAKKYAEENGHEFVVCDGNHGDETPDEPTTEPTTETTTQPVETTTRIVETTTKIEETTALVTEPSTTKPAETEPSTTKPAEVPSTTKPAVTESATTKPIEVPTTIKPVETTQPITTEPSTTKPVSTEPSTTKPIVEPTTEPVVTTKPTTEPTKPATTKPEPTTVKVVEEEIIKTPSTSTVKYGETLILHADFENIPDGATIEWSVEGEGVTIVPSEDGKTCAVTSTSTGDVTITAKYTDANGVEHVSEQEIESNASFWQKIVSFFKNLFGISRIIEQVVKF